MPPTLKSCSVKLLLFNKNINQLRVTCEHSGVLAFGPPTRYTSGVEAVSCPPSGGEDMLPSSYSGVSAFGPPTHATSGVEAVSCPPAGEADTMPPTLKRCSVKLLLFNKEFCAHSCGSSLVHICAHSWLFFGAYLCPFVALPWCIMPFLQFMEHVDTVHESGLGLTCSVASCPFQLTLFILGSFRGSVLPSDIIPLVWRQCLAPPRGRQTRCPQLSRVVV